MAKRGATVTRERLSRDTIVSSAIDLADREGLDAVTIRRLAQENGVTAMALYWHFREKDELLDAVAERLLSGVELPAASTASWSAQLQGALTAFLAAIRPHPALAELAFTRILTSEPGLTVAERILELLRAGGFSAEDAADVGTFLVSAIITLIAAEPGPHEILDTEARADAVRTKTAMLSSLSPQRYPNVIAAAPSLADCVSEDAYYERGVALLVAGTLGLQT